MKLLLTSAGITNNSIKNALRELTEKPFNELKMAFIPTAANVEEGSKDWLIDNLVEFKNLKFSHIDIIDISALPRKNWERRLLKADILVFSGGINSYLNYWLTKSGLRELLPEMLKTKVYVGISAGSMIASKKIALGEFKEPYFGVDNQEIGMKGLGLVEFYFRPHFNSPDFPKIRSENIKKLAENYPDPIYAVDDQTAIKVVDGKIEVVSEGEWEKF